MREQNRTYIAIDLKSFYASVECIERGLNPLTTNLVVADASRTEKTICLAVSPSLKAHKISGRARLFEVVQRVKELNAERRSKAPGHKLKDASYDDNEIKVDETVEIGYIAASPRMALYIEYSSKIYQVYLKYIAPEDIHVYSIDEVFMDVTEYLQTYGLTAQQLAKKMIDEVLKETGITAAAGIGDNLYLCKIAMDIVAKHVDADEDGVRIATLDEITYRRLLWEHRPLTDFWRVGRGYAKRLEEVGLYTMGDIARCSIGRDTDYYNEDLLYRMFGVNAELLIDHAWGWEPCTISDIKAYKPRTNSLTSGQVLQYPYDFQKARIVVREMLELLVLELVEKGLVTNQYVLTVGYDIENLTNDNIRKKYNGEVKTDHYGRKIPKHAHGTANLDRYTSSTKLAMDQMMKLYDEIVNPNLLIRRLNIAANNLILESEVKEEESFEQLSLFTDFEAENAKKKEEEALSKEKKLQLAMLDVKKKFGKNAILKGTDFQEGATTRERNNLIGGHKA